MNKIKLLKEFLVNMMTLKVNTSSKELIIIRYLKNMKIKKQIKIQNCKNQKNKFHTIKKIKIIQLMKIKIFNLILLILNKSCNKNKIIKIRRF